jgi:hypothetical protein
MWLRADELSRTADTDFGTSSAILSLRLGEHRMSFARKLVREHLKAGEKVPESGIYDVIHRNCHSQVIQALFVQGERLPECRFCANRVRFQLHQAVPHISEDRDFGTE